ncbi:MAG: phosphotransferase family protein [Gammaproteobacteria bacterium]|nr:phosphotransferase family protein [Gammaproteobacteria bacterium]
MSRDPNLLLNGLRRYLGCDDALTSVIPLSTGHSNETYRLAGINRILRMPPSKEGLLPPYDMAAQHAVLSAMAGYEQGPPVPRVYELCNDAAVIGDPFFIMDDLPGEAFEYVTPDWLKVAPAALPDRMCAQWIGAVTAVHRMPVRRMPAAPRSVVEEAQHWLDVAVSAEAPRALIAVLEDLVAHPPPLSGSATPIHGDPKHGNCLWDQQGRLLALLDWEMAGVGEPLLDLGYIMQFYDQGDAALASAGYELPGWWSKARTIDVWQQATGRTVIALHRYEAIQVAKVAAIIALGAHLFRTGRAPDPRFAAWATVIPGYVQLAARCAADELASY